MTTRLGGRTPKDVKITEGFNLIKKGDFRLPKKVRLQLGKEDKERKEARIRLEEKAKELRELNEINVIDEEGVKLDKDDEKSASKMLQDLRYAYRNAVGPDGKKGRNRLLALLESDAEFKFAVRELVKVDTAIVTAKLRKNEGPEGGVGQQNFFVVLKGLEEEKKFLTAGTEDKTVDMKQIQRAMNPDENSYEPEEETDKNAAPEILLGRQGGE